MALKGATMEVQVEVGGIIRLLMEAVTANAHAMSLTEREMAVTGRMVQTGRTAVAGKVVRILQDRL
jgi:hypothetical protein